jgi:hypothetical protein
MSSTKRTESAFMPIKKSQSKKSFLNSIKNSRKAFRLSSDKTVHENITQLFFNVYFLIIKAIGETEPCSILIDFILFNK